MRAPPEQLTIIRGTLFSKALSMERVIFSPTTDPMLPPIKLKSKTATSTESPSINPDPVIMASLAVFFLMLVRILSLYFFVSLNFSGSGDVRF